MARVDKATCFVTRRTVAGLELCVFDHPRAGRQLPAGTLLDGESAEAGARREAFEETGLAGLQVVSEIGTLPVGDASSSGGIRHLVHIVATHAAPDEWWVTTPDGGGLCWRCHWLPIDTASATLHPAQQPWLDAAQHQLLAGEHPLAAPRVAIDTPAELTIEMFWAPPWSATRALISWLEPPDGPPDEHVERAEAVAMSIDGDVVVVAEDERSLWMLPGGRRERGEALHDTLRRELREEACAQLHGHELLGFQRSTHLDGPRAGEVTFDAMYLARVALDPFVPRHETCARRAMSWETARTLPLWANPITQHLFARAADAAGGPQPA